MAPELLNPTSFGLEDSILTKECDIYAFGMVIYKVRRPSSTLGIETNDSLQITTRSQSGFPDELWEMLAVNWVEERAGKAQRRLPVTAMLDLLKESVEQWGKAMVPQAPNQCEENSRHRIYLSECRGLLMILW